MGVALPSPCKAAAWAGSTPGVCDGVQKKGAFSLDCRVKTLSMKRTRERKGRGEGDHEGHGATLPHLHRPSSWPWHAHHSWSCPARSRRTYASSCLAASIRSTHVATPASVRPGWIRNPQRLASGLPRPAEPSRRASPAWPSPSRALGALSPSFAPAGWRRRIRGRRGRRGCMIRAPSRFAGTGSMSRMGGRSLC